MLQKTSFKNPKCTKILLETKSDMQILIEYPFNIVHSRNPKFSKYLDQTLNRPKDRFS